MRNGRAPPREKGQGAALQRGVAPDRVPTQRFRWLVLPLSRIPALGETSRLPQVASDNANAIQCLCRWAGAFSMRNCRARTLPIGLLSHEHRLVPLVVWRVGRPCRRLVGRGDSHAGSNSAGASRTAFRSYRDPGRIGGRPDDEGASQHSRATAHQKFPAVCDPASRIPVAARFGRAAHRRAAFSLLATGEPGQASKPQVGLETCCSVAFGA